MANDIDNYLVSPDAVRQTASADGRLLNPGDMISGLRVVAFLGHGATSEVWRVRDDSLKRDLALKILDDSNDAIQQERFRAEARLLAQLDHPRIVKVHRFSETGGRSYFTMDLLRPLPVEASMRTIRRILDDVLEGLGFLHQKRVVHRDIKPSNILMDAAGRAVLTDLGIAHVEDETLSSVVRSAAAHNLTLADGHAAALGTPGFGAPEQFSGEEISPATDIHALGSLLLALFNGKPPLLWRGLIRRMTSSSPRLRPQSIRAVKTYLQLIGFLCALSKAAMMAVACLALWGVFSLCRPDWKDLPPDCIQRFPNRPEVVIRLPDEGHFFLQSLALTPILSAEAERIGPKFNKQPDGTVDIEYPLEVLKKESSWRRRLVKIIGQGTLKCPAVIAAEVHIPSGVTFITSGRYEINKPYIPCKYPPPDSNLSNNIDYAVYVVAPGANLIFTENDKYPQSLILNSQVASITDN